MMGIFRLVLVLLAGILITGCATSLTAANKARIHSVYIDVNLPKKPTILTGKVSAGVLLGGAVGAAIMMAGDDAPTMFKEYLEHNNIHMDAYIAEAFAQELRNRGISITNDKSAADANLTVMVQHYGLAGAGFGGMVSMKQVPNIMFQAKMTDKEGKTIWRRMGLIKKLFPEIQPRHAQEYLAEPKKTAQEFRLTAEKVVSEAASNM